MADCKCDLNIENNVWVEGVVDVANGKRGICMLDTMSKKQVVYVLQRNPQARMDLPKVTSDPELLELLEEVPLLSTGDPDPSKAAMQTRFPYYSQFKGNPPHKPGNSK